MAKDSSMVLLFLSTFLHILLVLGKRPVAPALYVLGDSLSDSGNNNFLQTRAKVNYKPYGVDFPYGPTGRFTNGRTFADIITQLLGLPFVPAYLGLSEGEKSMIKTGVNYASGSAGILPESGTAAGDSLSLDEQIDYFQTTVTTDLPKVFKTPSALSEYLSKSIFFVSIGANDYINNYLVPANYNSSHIYTPQQFAELLIKRLKTRLNILYNLGARKFVVLNIGRLGCMPAIVSAANPRPTTPCVENVNNLILLYNAMLPRMITNLENTLLGSIFVHGDFYNMSRTSAEAGITAAQTPCCEVDSIMGLCLPDSTPCLARSSYIYWDAYHPTEVANNGIAIDCFKGSGTCTPLNVQQLAQK